LNQNPELIYSISLVFVSALGLMAGMLSITSCQKAKDKTVEQPVFSFPKYPQVNSSKAIVQDSDSRYTNKLVFHFKINDEESELIFSNLDTDIKKIYVGAYLTEGQLNCQPEFNSLLKACQVGLYISPVDYRVSSHYSREAVLKEVKSLSTQASYNFYFSAAELATSKTEVIALTDLCEAKRHSFHYLAEKGQLKESSSTTNIDLVRKNQRVIRQDCNGQVTQDSVETVNSVSGTAKFSPPETLSRSTGGVSLFNESTCESKSSVLPVWNVPIFGAVNSIKGDTNGNLSVTVDMAPTVFNFRVTAGTNNIYYTYYQHCSTDDNCSANSKEVIQQGVYNLNVNYSEIVLEGEKIIKNEHNCKPPQTENK
jgi:hypothetical protein